jgi:hypothetical protein
MEGSRINAVYSFFKKQSPYPAPPVLTELLYMDAVQAITGREIPVCDTSTPRGQEFFLGDNKYATHIGCDPQPSQPILKDVISPGRGIGAAVVPDDKIAERSRQGIIIVDSMVSSYPDVSLGILVHFPSVW